MNSLFDENYSVVGPFASLFFLQLGRKKYIFIMDLGVQSLK